MKTVKALTHFVHYVKRGWGVAIGYSLILCVAAAAPPSFEWYKTAFSSDQEFCSDVAVDTAGNVFWGMGLYNSQSYNRFSLRKFSKAGALQWTREIPSSGSAVTALATDSTGAVIFITARQSVTVSSGAIPYYQWDGFFGKFDSAGNQVFTGWDKSMFNSIGGAVDPCSVGVATDLANNVILAFPFGHISWGGQSWDGTIDLALMKLAPGGGLIWMRRVVGSGSNIPTGVAVDRDSNIYLSGYNLDLAAFDAVTVQSNGGRDGFIAKYDSSGSLLWIRRPNCSGDDKINGLAISPENTLWFHGSFKGGNIAFGSTETLSATGEALFIGSADTDGNFRTAGKVTGAINITKIVAPTTGAPLLTGRFEGTNVMSVKVENQGVSDIYLASVGSTGVPNWVKTFGYVFGDDQASIAATAAGEIYASATIQGGVIFDGTFVSGSGNADVILLKLNDSSVSSIPVIAAQPTSVATYFGSQIGLSVTVTSPASVSYQWFRDGLKINGATSATLTIGSVRPSDDGNYYVEVTNQYGTVRSDSVHLIVRGDAPVVVTTLAGTNVSGFVDSANPTAVRFYSPDSPAIQNDGTVVIPDAGNHAIRLLEPNGTVGTLAGKGTAGLTNGPASAAYFNVPIATAINAAWDVYVADGYNNVIRKISAAGARTVATYAGSGEKGFQDGAAAQAKFSFPNDLVCDPEGNLFVTEFEGHRVRKITPDGVVSTYAGTGVAGYKDGAAAQAMFNQPAGIARDGFGNLYVTEWVNHTIRKITPAGNVTTIAGTAAQSGFVDGPAVTTARLNVPNGIATDSKGNVFFTEWGNSSVRRIDPLGDVLTLVGTAGLGFKDGGRATAQVNRPGGLAVHPDGSLVVADTDNNAMRRVVWQTNAAPTEAVVLIEVNPSITIFGVAGKTYRVESAESLVAPQWTVLGEVTLVSPVETWFDSQPLTRARRFYRAILKN